MFFLFSLLLTTFHSNFAFKSVERLWSPIGFSLSSAVPLCSDSSSFIIWHKFPLAPCPKIKHDIDMTFSPQLFSGLFLSLMWFICLVAFMGFFHELSFPLSLHKFLTPMKSSDRSFTDPQSFMWRTSSFRLEFHSVLYNHLSFSYLNKPNSQSLHITVILLSLITWSLNTHVPAAVVSIKHFQKNHFQAAVVYLFSKHLTHFTPFPLTCNRLQASSLQVAFENLFHVF